jgi:signal peptidase I
VRHRLLREALGALVLALLLALYARCFLVQAFRIPTASMAPTLRVGDHVLVNKFVFGPARYRWERRLLPLREPRAGDVVVFRFPRDRRRDFVKRVVGVPGNRLALDRKRLAVDGREVAETAYVVHTDTRAYPDSPLLHPYFRHRDNLGPLVVPAGHYFVLGDNRDRSEDSRTWGFVPQGLVRGRTLLVYWSRPAAEASPAAASEGRRRQHAPRWVR